MNEKNQVSLIEAERIGDILGIDWKAIAVKHFRIGLEMELENHYGHSENLIPEADYLTTGKVVQMELEKFPEHYLHLALMEKEADEYWANV